VECDFKIRGLDRLELSYRYAHNLLSEDDTLEFGVHISDCEECQEEVDLQIDIKRSFKRNMLFENLESAYNSKEWDKVIELGNELRNLDYSENVFKVNDKFDEARVNIAYNNLCTAYDKEDWQEVIRLGDEMEALSYDREVHPIKRKVLNAKNALARQAMIEDCYKKLCQAYDNKDWKSVIDFGHKIKTLGYDESVYPIRRKVGTAKSVINRPKRKKPYGAGRMQSILISKITSTDGKIIGKTITFLDGSGHSYTSTFTKGERFQGVLTGEIKFELSKHEIIVDNRGNVDIRTQKKVTKKKA